MDYLQSFEIVEQIILIRVIDLKAEPFILIIVVVTRTRVVNWEVDSLASRRAGVIDLEADSDLWNYFIIMVSCINSVIVELVSQTDLKENQTIEVILIVRGILIIIVTFTFISFKINLLINKFLLLK